jgi:hypothetical protein
MEASLSQVLYSGTDASIFRVLWRVREETYGGIQRHLYSQSHVEVQWRHFSQLCGEL